MWVPKARKGQFLGRSRTHASSIGLIQNLETGNISCQFHVTFDDYFTSVGSTQDNVALEDTWTHLFKFMSEDYREPSEIDNLPELEQGWLTIREIEDRRRITPQRRIRLGIPDEDDEVREQPEQNDIIANDNNLDFNERNQSDDSDNEDSVPQPEGVRRNPGRAMRGINRCYHNNDFINLTFEER